MPVHEEWTNFFAFIGIIVCLIAVIAALYGIGSQIVSTVWAMKMKAKIRDKHKSAKPTAACFCEECESIYNPGEANLFCMSHDRYVSPDHFCAYAKKRPLIQYLNNKENFKENEK